MKLAAKRIRTLEKAKAAELSRIAALRKKQLLQAVARATDKAKKDARREAHRAKERHSRGHHHARPKHHSSSHSATLEEKLKGKLGMTEMKWLEHYIQEEVKKDFAAELEKARKQHLVRIRRA